MIANCCWILHSDWSEGFHSFFFLDCNYSCKVSIVAIVRIFEDFSSNIFHNNSSSKQILILAKILQGVSQTFNMLFIIFF